MWNTWANITETKNGPYRAGARDHFGFGLTKSILFFVTSAVAIFPLS